jgi:hypothetical protein
VFFFGIRLNFRKDNQARPWLLSGVEVQGAKEGF